MRGRFPCGDLTDDRQAQRRVLARFRHVLGAHRVAVHGRIVEPRQVDRGNDVFTDVQVHCIQNVLRKGRSWFTQLSRYWRCACIDRSWPRSGLGGSGSGSSCGPSCWVRGFSCE